MNIKRAARLIGTTAVLSLVCGTLGQQPMAPDGAAATTSEDSGPPPLVVDENGVPEGFRLVHGDILMPIGVEQGTWDADLWPNGIVPYRFDANVSQSERQSMLGAMALWEEAANVDFILRTNQTAFVHIRDSSGDQNPRNNSAIGRVGSQQTINITSWGNQFIQAHELAHTLGYFHEQSRPDRNNFVQIEANNIRSGAEGNFDLENGAGAYGPYDFDSVMHYGQCFFSNCCATTGCPECPNDLPNCRTITVLPAFADEWQNAIGQRDHLSFWDQRIMSFLYPEANWRFVDTTRSGNGSGSFVNPWRLFTSGLVGTPAGGTVWLLQPGTYVAGTTVLDKAMTIEAPLGGAVLTP